MNKLRKIWVHKDITIPSTIYSIDYHYKYIGFALLTTNSVSSNYYDIIFPREVTLIKNNNSRDTWPVSIQSFNKELFNNLLSKGTISYI
jgi:hypothetical protein